MKWKRVIVTTSIRVQDATGNEEREVMVCHPYVDNNGQKVVAIVDGGVDIEIPVKSVPTLINILSNFIQNKL